MGCCKPPVISRLLLSFGNCPRECLWSSGHCAIPASEAPPAQLTSRRAGDDAVWARGRGAGEGGGRGSSAAFAAAPPTVRSRRAPRSSGAFLRKTGKGSSSYKLLHVFSTLNSVSVLLSGCFRSLIDDERTFANSPLRRGHF